MQCPCGSELTYNQCCAPIINQENVAQTAEQLMRSRYSAYHQKQSQYIADTYALAQQKHNPLAEIDAWVQQTTWLKLTIIDTDYSDPIQHYVEFCARYICDQQVMEFQEKSRFIQEQGQWRYIDGDITRQDQLDTLTRNSPCPCASGKKYKRCCIK
ncbi:YchJ family protein [Thalassotalea aquiviva]|uniref:YchJ family protein n=1 Tax=Thalassotalea aquiviva TaxID=3242415 RepID=UPI00352B7269